MRIRTGLCSVTFRQLTPDQIVPLAAGAGLEVIEWGGDVHVPPGDLERAARVATLTRDAGLSVCSYGSYFRSAADEDLAPVLDSAQALGGRSGARVGGRYRLRRRVPHAVHAGRESIAGCRGRSIRSRHHARAGVPSRDARRHTGCCAAPAHGRERRFGWAAAVVDILAAEHRGR